MAFDMLQNIAPPSHAVFSIDIVVSSSMYLHCIDGRIIINQTTILLDSTINCMVTLLFEQRDIAPPSAP